MPARLVPARLVPARLVSARLVPGRALGPEGRGHAGRPPPAGPSHPPMPPPLPSYAPAHTRQARRACSRSRARTCAQWPVRDAAAAGGDGRGWRAVRWGWGWGWGTVFACWGARYSPCTRSASGGSPPSHSPSPSSDHTSPLSPPFILTHYEPPTPSAAAAGQRAIARAAPAAHRSESGGGELMSRGSLVARRTGPGNDEQLWRIGRGREGAHGTRPAYLHSVFSSPAISLIALTPSLPRPAACALCPAAQPRVRAVSAAA